MGLQYVECELCKWLKFNQTEELYMPKLESFQENGIHRISWDFMIQTDHQLLVRRQN